MDPKLPLPISGDDHKQESSAPSTTTTATPAPPAESSPPPSRDGGRWGTWLMGHPGTPQTHPVNQQAATWDATEAMDPANVLHSTSNYYSNPPIISSSSSSSSAAANANNLPYAYAAARPDNPYIHTTPVPNSVDKSPMDMILTVLNKFGKRVDDATRKAEQYAGNVWQHLKTSPNPADAAMGRIVQGTKELIEGGPEKIFQQNFGSLPREQLERTFASYFSTTSGPVIGTLYLTNMRVAFCSDSPLCYSPIPGQTQWIYYKVVINLDQLMAVTPSSNKMNPTEKYIELLTKDGHEFWFMGFVSYDSALRHLTEALNQGGALH